MNKLKLTLILASFLLPVLVSADESKTHIILKSSNVVVLGDVVNGQSVGEVIQKFTEMNDGILSRFRKKDPLYLFLNTPGGDVEAGLQLIEAIKAQGRPVHVITSFAASMGFQISQNLGNRYILRSGILMSHRAAGGVEGQFGGQEPSQVQNRYQLWLNRITELDMQTVMRTNGKQTLESYRKAYDNELWLTGEEAVEQGYADEVVSVSCDSSLSGVTTRSAQFMGMTVDYDILNCPISSGVMNPRVHVETNKGMKSLVEFRTLNGGFGDACLTLAKLDQKVVCAADLTLSMDKIVQIKNDFVDKMNNKKDHVIQMKF